MPILRFVLWCLFFYANGLAAQQLRFANTDLCQFFPEPVQSWKANSTLNIQNNNNRISGWSQNYIDKNLNNGKLAVGFDNTSYHAQLRKTCDVGSCWPGGEKINTPPSLTPSFSSRTSLYLDEWGYTSACNGSNCSYSTNGKVVTITLLKPLQTLSVSAYNNIEFVIVFPKTEGSYGFEVANYMSYGKVDTRLSEGGTYTFKSLNFSSQGGKFSTEKDVRVFVTQSFTQNNQIKMMDLGGQNDLIFYGPSAAFNFSASGGAEWGVRILADSVTFNNPMTIKGRVTTNNLKMNTANTHIISEDDSCENAKLSDSNYTLELIPKNNISLTCETQTPELQVHDNGVLATDFTGTVTVILEGVPQTLNAINGELKQTISIATDKMKTVALEAYIDGQEDAVIQGSYQFVPYKFHVNDQFVIANKPTQVRGIVQACQENTKVDIGYVGQPQVSSNLVKPKKGEGTLNYQPSFSAGVSLANLLFTESGVVEVTLEDERFECSQLGECPENGIDKLTGRFMVSSRPWTLAICDPEGRELDGNITNASSFGFQPAGETFNLQIKPIAWITSGANSLSLRNTSTIKISQSFCSASVTKNFFAEDAPKATIVLNYDVAAPSVDKGGNKGILSNKTLGQLSEASLDATSSSKSEGYYVELNDVTWDEVGVLQLETKLKDDYLGMTVNPSYRHLGRFYPDKLTITDNTWNYANQHEGFAYMGQPISYDFTVQAQNKNNKATRNYGAFHPSLIADIKLFAIDSEGKEFGDRIKNYNTMLWNLSSNWNQSDLNITNHEITFNKRVKSQTPYITKADGPVTSGFGLRVVPNNEGGDVADSINFVDLNLNVMNNELIEKNGQKFSLQPNFRYGRMVLDDASGTLNSKILIPLRTEYWHNTRFVLNHDDSGSVISTENDKLCKQTLWQSPIQASNSTLGGANPPLRITQGESLAVFANPQSGSLSPLREQVRFWMMMDDNSMLRTSPQRSEEGINCNSGILNQPWLQYNWRDKGDEDPSTVVTFGIFRGNDKIIYRGEAGLIAP